MRIELRDGDTLVYGGKVIDRSVLEAVLDTHSRLLWAFVESGAGDVMAVSYSEERVIWLSESDIVREEEVEL